MEVAATGELICMNGSYGSIPSLPYELQLQIFSFLVPHELTAASLVCRNWKKLSVENVLWKNFFGGREPKLLEEEADYRQQLKDLVLEPWTEILEEDFQLVRLCQTFQQAVDRVGNITPVRIHYAQVEPQEVWFDRMGIPQSRGKRERYRACVFLNAVRKFFSNGREEHELFFTVESTHPELLKKIQYYQSYLNQNLENKIQALFQKNFMHLPAVVAKNTFPLPFLFQWEEIDGKIPGYHQGLLIYNRDLNLIEFGSVFPVFNHINARQAAIQVVVSRIILKLENQLSITGNPFKTDWAVPKNLK